MCSVNAAVGREKECELTPAPSPKRIFVIGGGPAGMEAARISAARGHRVTLVERQGELGGQLCEAVVPPHKDNLHPFLDYLRAEMDRAGVEVRCGTEARPGMFSGAADALIAATGTTEAVPPVDGIRGVPFYTARQILRGAAAGQNVLVIGGGLVGCETAEFLAAQKKQVTVVEQLGEVASAMPLALRNLLRARMGILNIAIITGASCRRFGPNTVHLATPDGREHDLEFDTLVIAAGGKPEAPLLQSLAQSFPAALQLAGDCLEPRGIAEAILDGYLAGLRV